VNKKTRREDRPTGSRIPASLGLRVRTSHRDDFETAFGKFVQSQDEFDLWFKERALDISGST
jgi:hypothetical protein